MPVHPVLVQSDEAGTFLRTHSTGRPTRDDVDLWRAIERDATEVCAAVLGAALLVATWALVSVGVF